MAMLPIVIYPDPRLRQVSQPVEEITKNIRQLVDDMKETMYATQGAGLAAIQIGEPIRLFLLDGMLVNNDSKAEAIVLVNPEIISYEGTEEGDEGCLSFPGIFVPITRATRCTVRAMNLDNEPVEFTGEGIISRAIQHETDHLNGRLIIDHVGKLKRKLIDRRMRKTEIKAD